MKQIELILKWNYLNQITDSIGDFTMALKK